MEPGPGCGEIFRSALLRFAVAPPTGSPRDGNAFRWCGVIRAYPVRLTGVGSWGLGSHPRGLWAVLLIVMHESGTWRARPGQVVTFGRGVVCTITLPADRGVSRSAGRLVFEQGTWWLRNDSSSAVLYVSGDRGFRVDLPPGMRAPVQQWHAKIWLQGLLDSYTLRLRLPDLDDAPGQDPGTGQSPGTGQGGGIPVSPTGEHLVTSTRRRPPLSGSDRLILAARFEDYLDWRHTGPAAPRSAKQTAERIGWQPHTVAKRCENIRDRYSRLGVPGLRGPRALDELAMLLISTGELTAGDLRRLSSQAAVGQDQG